MFTRNFPQQLNADQRGADGIKKAFLFFSVERKTAIKINYGF